MKTLTKKRLIISFIVALVVFIFIISPVYNFYKYSYSAVFDDLDEYLYLFDDPSQLDTFFSGIGQIRETDRIYSYLTKDRKLIEIFEFKELNSISLEKIDFSSKKNIFPDYKEWGRVLNYDITSVPIIGVKNNLLFNHKLFIDFNKNASIELIKDEPNCKVYYGSLLKMMLSGENKEPLVLYDFTNVAKTIIAFYKTEKNFLLIIITSDSCIIEKQDLEILRLKCN